MKKALFLDRDGVVNIDKNYVHKQEDFEFCDGIFELCRFFTQKDFLLFIVTNQSGIARRYYTHKDFKFLSQFMLREFAKEQINFAKIYYCPHLQNCTCRKPKPGMLLKAKKEFDIDLRNSFFIGDNLSDIQAGLRAKIKNLVLIREKNPNLDDLKKADLRQDSFKIFANLKEFLFFCEENL